MSAGPGPRRTAVRRRATRLVAAVAVIAAGLAAGRSASAADDNVTGVGPATAPAGAPGQNTAVADTVQIRPTPASQPRDPVPARRATLMTGLDEVGVGKPLRDLGISIYGHVEGGYTYQFLQPNDTIFGRTYDYQSNRVLLNQAAISVERRIPVATDHFDVGFAVQALEGTDAQYTESFQSFNPAKQSSNYVFDVGGPNSRYQFDLPDLYVDFGVPLGRGLRIRAGRFEFFKPIDPNARLFYSTSFVYTNALPFTNTGVTAAYDFSDSFGLEAGVSRGYNLTVHDYNGSVDFIGKGRVRLNKQTAFVGTLIVGPELARDSHDYTVLFDGAVSHKLTPAVTLTADGIYARQFGDGNTSLGYNPFNPPVFRLPASYYGVSGLAVWQVNRYYSLGGRVEWFRDDGGILSGASRSLYEATVGTTITPFPFDAVGQNLKIRPEVRYDYSNREFFGLTPGGFPTRKSQLTFGVDVIYNF